MKLQRLDEEQQWLVIKSKSKRLVCHIWACYRAKAKEGAILRSLFLFFLFVFVTFILSPHSHSFFLSTCSFTVKVILWFSLGTCYCCPPPIVHGKSPLYTVCRDLLLPFLTFNYFCLAWVSLLITTGLSTVQPPQLTYASCTTPHHQTKKLILFACSPWHSYLPRCKCSFFLSLMACT